MTTPRKLDPRADGRRKLLLYVLLIVIVLLNLRRHGTGAFNPLLAGFAAGLGALITLQLGQLWQLLLGRFSGVAVTGLTFGFGARWTNLRAGGLPLSLRRVPFPFLGTTSVLVGGPRLRLRLWLSTLLSNALQIGLGVWLLVEQTPLGFGLGFGALLMPAMALTLAARLPLTPGWVLFRVPFMPAEALDSYALTPPELAATRALREGRIADAGAALGDAGPSFQAHTLRAVIAVGEGRYAEASALAEQAVLLAPHPRAAAVGHFLQGAALVGAAETGELPPTEYLPRLTLAVQAGRAGQPLLARYVSPPADLALMQERREEAVLLARKAALQAVEVFWQAQAECSYAAALAATGRAEEARAALARAETAMPELARIAVVATRVELMEISVDR